MLSIACFSHFFCFPALLRGRICRVARLSAFAAPAGASAGLARPSVDVVSRRFPIRAALAAAATLACSGPTVSAHDTGVIATRSDFGMEDTINRIVRDIAAKLNRDERVAAYSVESENFESIHNHSAYAMIERDKEAEQAATTPEEQD